ncbi:MAG: DUF2147 domain-containing protein [Acetobacteraceae bacterium]|nr:DUF2147 domain-containing protein [Acetobacteraceae bacterium]
MQGLWLTQGRDGVIRIAPCGLLFCGWIAGLDLGPGEAMPHDVQGRPQCGLQLISGLRQIGPNEWQGSITNPRDGKVYDARLSMDEGKLRLRGYVLVPLFGATQIWTRYPGGVTPNCRMTAPG